MECRRFRFIVPVISTDAASGSAVNKAYVDSRDSNYLPLSGGTLSGILYATEIGGDGRDYIRFSTRRKDDKDITSFHSYVAVSRRDDGEVRDNKVNAVDIVSTYRYDEETKTYLSDQLTVKTDPKTDKLVIVANSHGISKHLVRSVNGTSADEDGNVTLDVGVTKVNNIPPKDGNVTLDAKSLTDVLKTLYPIGSIYIGTMNVCPLAALFGTWTNIEGRYLLASGSLYGGWNTEKYEAGNYVAAGLPNITGQIGSMASDNRTSVLLNTSGAFGCKQSSTNHGSYHENWYNGYNVSFSASSSNSIYGKSNAARPAAFVVNVWRRTA